jgi:hypothetical protein
MNVNQAEKYLLSACISVSHRAVVEGALLAIMIEIGLNADCQSSIVTARPVW